ncbi:MAG: type II toxin-antitoxin system VapC family toxin [Kiritimatiellia bacterium]
MILVDTSIWVDHLRYGNRELAALLEEGDAAVHPFVIGELACGSMRNRREIIALLQELPSVPEMEHGGFMVFVDRHHLWGLGLGFVDVHLLASSSLAGIPLWTADKMLFSAAFKLGLSR